MKKILLFIIILSITLALVGCKSKDTATGSENVVQKNDYKKTALCEIDSDNISEITMGLSYSLGSTYLCSKNYTDVDTINKTIGFLADAPLIQTDSDVITDQSDPYAITVKDKDGKEVYSIVFSEKQELGYACSFKNYTDDSYNTFYIDSEYLYDLIEHIATIDGREPSWLYSLPFKYLYEQDIGSFEITYDGKQTLYTVSEDGASVSSADKNTNMSNIKYIFGVLQVRKPSESETLDAASIQQKLKVVFCDRQGETMCEFYSDILLIDSNKYAVVYKNYKDGADDGAYYVPKAQFEGFLEQLSK